MGLNISSRRDLTQQLAQRYRRSGKKEKGRILDGFVESSEYKRKYAIQLLNWWGRTRMVRLDGKLVKLVVGRPRRAKRRLRPRRYDQEVLAALKPIWYVFDFMCGKRLVVVLRTMLPMLESFGEIELTAQVRGKLNTISAATIDRLLQHERARLRLKGRPHTKPGSLLKHQIPIRTFADWNEQEPGFFEIDLVGHDGGNAAGDFCHTLTITDVDTGWVDLHGLKNKAQRWTHEAIGDAARRRLPATHMQHRRRQRQRVRSLTRRSLPKNTVCTRRHRHRHGRLRRAKFHQRIIWWRAVGYAAANPEHRVYPYTTESGAPSPTSRPSPWHHLWCARIVRWTPSSAWRRWRRRWKARHSGTDQGSQFTACRGYVERLWR